MSKHQNLLELEKKLSTLSKQIDKLKEEKEKEEVNRNIYANKCAFELLGYCIGKDKYINMDSIVSDLKELILEIFEDIDKKGKDYFYEEDTNTEDVVSEFCHEYDETLFKILFIVEDDYLSEKMIKRNGKDIEIGNALYDCIIEYVKKM